MNAAISEKRLPDMLLHGWRAFDLAPEHDESRAMIFSNLALTALGGDLNGAAVQGFLHILTITDVARFRLPAYGGLQLALSNLGDRARMDDFEAKAIVEGERSNMAFEVARFFVQSAEAWCALGDPERAEISLDRAESMLSNSTFHELSMRVESLRQQQQVIRHDQAHATQLCGRAPTASAARLFDLVPIARGRGAAR